LHALVDAVHVEASQRGCVTPPSSLERLQFMQGLVEPPAKVLFVAHNVLGLVRIRQDFSRGFVGSGHLNLLHEHRALVVNHPTESPGHLRHALRQEVLRRPHGSQPLDQVSLVGFPLRDSLEAWNHRASRCQPVSKRVETPSPFALPTLRAARGVDLGPMRVGVTIISL
jgi:hypothetical protein